MSYSGLNPNLQDKEHSLELSIEEEQELAQIYSAEATLTEILERPRKGPVKLQFGLHAASKPIVIPPPIKVKSKS